jgi:hypothetical protein
MSTLNPQTMSNYAALLKQYYVPDRVNEAIVKDCSLLGMLPKQELEGSTQDIPIIYSGTAGRSRTFATALANKGSTTNTKFQLTTFPNYALANIQRQVLLASRGKPGAFMDAATANIDASMSQMSRSIGIDLYRDGTGIIGVSSTFTSGNTVITLTRPTDAVNFFVGEYIQLVSTAPALRTGSVQIVAVNKSINGGTITVASDITVAISGATAGDSIVAAGDYNLAFKGLPAWLPTAVPSATSFFGVNRSVDPSLYGVFFSGSGSLRYEALINGQSEIARVGGGKPTHAFCSPGDFRAVVLELQAQVRRPEMKIKEVPVGKDSLATAGYTGVVIEGDAGTIELFSDRWCPPNVCYVMQMNDWHLGYLGDSMVDLVYYQGGTEGKDMMIDPSTDGYDIRFTSYLTLGCRSPGHSGVVYNFGL